MSSDPRDSLPKLSDLTGVGEASRRHLAWAQDAEASRQRMSQHRQEMGEALEAIQEARAERDAREVASYQALEVTAKSIGELLRVHVEGEQVAADRHTQMLRWTRASAIGAVAAAVLALIAIIVTLTVA